MSKPMFVNLPYSDGSLRFYNLAMISAFWPKGDGTGFSEISMQANNYTSLPFEEFVRLVTVWDERHGEGR